MKRKKLEKKSLKAVIALAVALAFVIPGAAAFANVGTIDVTTNLENTDTINNIVEDGEGPIDKREVTSDTSDVVEDAVLGSGGNIIYVGSGPGNDSATIQGGIDLANPGDTVYVYNGIYTEYDMLVDKSLNLVGESKEDVIVDSTGGTYAFKFVQVSNTNISNFTMKNGVAGIWVDYSGTDVEHINIINCIIHDISYGIYAVGDGAKMRNSIIKNCEVYNANAIGLNLVMFTSNIVSECDIHDNALGIDLEHPQGQNTLYHNNFVSNTEHVYKPPETPRGHQIWDDGYPSGGNYWDDYTNADNNHGPNQDIPGSDGIVDTPYLVVANAVYNIDNYPLMYPWGTPPEITNVTATPESQSVGGNVNITCTVEDVHNGVKPAIVYITDPNSNQQGFEMTGINVDYLGNGDYYYNATYSMFGMYSYFIRAENWRDCGNESDMYEFKIKGSDTVPPVTNCTLMGTVGENDWYVSDVEVTLTVTDPHPSSGINYTMYNLDETGWTEYTNPFTVTTDEYHTVEYYSVDMAGNTENTTDADFKIDQTAPETSCELDPPEPDGENDWYVSDVEVTLTATDDTSGINYTMYNLDGTGWIGYTVSIMVNTDGTHTVEYYSVDMAGNTENTTDADFKIDQTAPETSCELDPPEPDGENDWYISPVTVTLEATDGGSGVEFTYYKLDDNGEYEEYDGPITFSEDGEYKLWYYSVDYAGNEETKKSVDFKIDQTNPTINLTVETDLTKWLLTAEVFDETSDVAKVEFYVNSVLVGTVTTAPYKWEGSEKGTAYAIVFDNAGNKARSEDVKSQSHSQSQSSSLTSVQRVFLSNSESTVDSKLEDTSNADSITDAKPNEITVDPEPELDVGHVWLRGLLFLCNRVGNVNHVWH